MRNEVWFLIGFWQKASLTKQLKDTIENTNKPFDDSIVIDDPIVKFL